MTFSEKLTFLLDLSGTSNAELARAACIDPSQVSRLKNGTRNIPKRTHTIDLMAEHFASRCTSDYQRSALAKTLGDESLFSNRSVSRTADIICSWLRSRQSDSNARLDNFMRSFEGYSGFQPVSPPAPLPEQNAVESKVFCYFGNDGRRRAMSDVFSYALEHGIAGEILIISDENLDWFTQDPEFSRSIMSVMELLVERGFSVRRIVFPLRDSVSAIESLERWMPLYMTGSLSTYHYPRLRDGLYRRFMIVVPGLFSLTSLSLGSQSECGMTCVSYETSITETDKNFFYSFLNQCVPLASPFIHDRNPIVFAQNLLDFHSIPADGMSKWHGMSCSTVPDILVEKLELGCSDPGHREVIRIFRTIQQVIEHNLEAGYRFVEIIRPFTAQQVREGTARMALSLLQPDDRFYSVEDYRHHLQHLLALQEKYPNYYLIVDDGDMSDAELHVKEGHSSLLVRTTPPFTIFSITEHNTVSAVSEFLLLQATRYGSSLVIQRRHSIEKIHAILDSLDQ